MPRKNIRLFAGLPLIAHPIRAALQSGVFRQVVVSTDDEEIASIARQHGAEVPFIRNAALADDFAGTAEVVTDALQQLAPATICCCLYPTAPMVTPDDLRDAANLLTRSGADTVVAVTGYDFPPQRAFRLSDDGRLAWNWPEHELTRSQDLPELVHDAGAFYFLDVARFLARKRIVGPHALPLHIDRLRAVDIDTEEDFRFAEALFAMSRDRHNG